SSDPDGDELTYSWMQVPGGTAVVITGADTDSPTFTAPVVAAGGETLTFNLTVTDGHASATDTVSITVVNVNHPPVADAGTDQSIAEGSPATLDGSASFDVDADAFSYAWTQVGGPAVALTGGNTTHPTFTAPFVNAGGEPGVVATLVFELLVDDGQPADVPAPGHTLADVRDRVTVAITNTNNRPIAAAGPDQTVNEHSAVALSGAASSDPDSDSLTFIWVQVANGSPSVALSGAATATPSFTAPFVNTGGANLEFKLTVNDGYGGSATDTVVIHVQNINDPPLAAAARPTEASLWPANHHLVSVGITGVTDPNNNATITITGVTQDEPTNGQGDGDTPIDAIINSDGTVLLRAERSGGGDGRVYRIAFTARDLEGSTSGVVKVGVPKSKKDDAIESAGVFDSTH
ncbi:MAG TPA: PKD domain-containing protein, partial [Chthoniobacterales bacterium]|nr:PKD domain-containing protein [Chthoniobacterales bacterium]